MANLKDLVVNGCARVIDTIYGKLGYGIEIKTNGTSQGIFNNTENKTINITSANIGASASSHTHNYAGSSSAGGQANDSAKLGGMAASHSTGANTIVTRQANGYTFVNYINSNTSNNENPTISQIIVTNGGDHYYRKASLAHLKTSLGAMTPASHTHSSIVTEGDNRATATTPNSYSNNIVFRGLKTNASFGSPSGDTYSYVVGLRGWSDSSGGYSHELAFNNSGIYARRGATTAWGSWAKLWQSGDAITGAVYNDYAELFPRIEGDNELSTEVGDIIALDTSKKQEGYRKAIEQDDIIVGVHSNEWGHLIGGEQPPNGEDFLQYNLPKFIPVSLAGRVWVNIKPNTDVKIGQYIAPSDIAGKGIAVSQKQDNIVGRVVALDLSNNKVKVKVMC